MDNVHYIHVDSKNRDSNLYPHGNNYVLHLLNPIKNAIRVDLVSAKIPNSMYNLTNGSNVLSSPMISLSNGFYSSQSLVYELNQRLNTSIEKFEYISSEGKFIYLTNYSTGLLTVNSSEFAKMVGLDVKTYTVSPLDTSICGFSYGVKSQRVIDLSLNEFVFLDIEEFRTPFFDDAKSLPFSGINAGNMFAAIPMDVPSTSVKTFKENTDYFMSMNIAPQNLSRLTIHWYDKNLQSLNFQGYENNGFILRVHTKSTREKIEEDDVRPVDIDAQIEFIKRKLEEDAQKEEEETKKKTTKKMKFGKWSVIVALIGLFTFWFISSKKLV